MTTLLKPWDPADHLDSNEAIVAYLDAALEEAEPQIIAAALSDIARARGRGEIAQDLGFGLDGAPNNRSASASVDAGKILKAIHALGLSLHVHPLAAE